MDVFFDLREDKTGKPRIGGKFTRIDFQELYSALKYLITATVATIINFYFNEGIESWAIGYGETNAPYWLGTLSIILAIISLAYLMGWIRRKERIVLAT